MSETNEKLNWAVTQLRLETQRIVLANTLSLKYAPNYQIFPEWEWEFKGQTPNRLLVWATDDRTDEPFNYIPDEKEQRVIGRIVKKIRSFERK